jgi:hypothetical protein
MSKVSSTVKAQAVEAQPITAPKFTGKALGIKWWNGLSYTVELTIVDDNVVDVSADHHGPDLGTVTVAKASKILKEMCNTAHDNGV